MAFPQIGIFELIIILVVILVIFGVGRLPEVGGALGRGIREFRDAQSGDDDSPPSSSEKKEQDNPPSA
jgi:sec-independent protein translocase protein TatA